jgi:hypothetical protein
MHLGTAVAQRLCQCGGRLNIQITNTHLGTLLCQSAHGCRAYASGPTTDENCFALKVSHSFVPV